MQNEIHNEKVMYYLEQQLPAKKIRVLLQQEGVDESALEHLMEFVRKYKGSVRTRKGLRCLAWGFAFLLAGFFCTLVFQNTSINYNIALYGFTSVGVTLVILGMAFLLG